MPSRARDIPPVTSGQHNHSRRPCIACVAAQPFLRRQQTPMLAIANRVQVASGFSAGDRSRTTHTWNGAFGGWMVRDHVRLAQCVACPLPGRPRLSCKTRPSTPTPFFRPSKCRARPPINHRTCQQRSANTHVYGQVGCVGAVWAQGVGCRGEGASTGVHSAPSLEWNERRRGRLGLKGACVAELLTSD